jgi:hypothetical protein
MSELNLLERLIGCKHMQRISLYADDVVLFCKPNFGDFIAIREILHVFGGASGLRVNYEKSSATLIRGDTQDADLVAEMLHYQIKAFPIKYLGLQLAL